MARRSMLGAMAGAALLALLGGCGSSGSGALGHVQVLAITSPFPAGVSSPFTVTGSGFSTIFGNVATVRFTAESGTPFNGGTTATVDVVGTVQSNTEVTGMSPIPSAATDFNAFVTVILASGASGTSATAIATFQVQPPDAFDDAYNATGNVLLLVDAASGVLSNDTPGGLFVSAFDATSVNGGTVSVAADGSFTFNPAPGFEGVDTFTYTASNGSQQDVATVTITITEMVWFINVLALVPGDGRMSSPFDSVSAFNAQQGGGGADDPEAGDTIYVYRNPGGPVPGNLALLAGQVLVGEGVALVVNAAVLVPAGSNTVLQASAGTTVTLATNNTVRGFQLVNTAGAALAGSAFGTLNVDTVALQATGGTALSLDNGTTTASFSSVASTSSPARGVFLNAVSGTLTLNSVTVSLPLTHGVQIQNSPATVNLNGLSIVSSSARGLLVSGSGTVVVTGVANSIATTTGVPFEFTNSGIGAAGIQFLSIGSNGAASGIVLTNTTGAGGFTVTGDGTAASNASGGAIVSSTSSAIVLSSTHDVSISQLDVIGAGGLGIDAQSVRNLTYRRASVVGTGDANNEHNIGLQNLFGTSLIEDVRVDNINETGVAIRNDTTDDLVVDTLVVRRLDVQDHQVSAFAEDGVDIQAEGTSNLSVTVDDCDFTLSATAILGVNATSTGAATLETIVTGGVFNAANAFGSGGIQMVASGTGTTTFRVLGCTILDSKFTPIIANNEDDVTSFVTISGNTLEGTGLTHNGFGIQIRQDENGAATVLVSGNTITDVGFDGVNANGRDSTDATGTLNVTLTNNSIAAPLVFGAGVAVLCDDLNTVRTSMTGNTLSGSGTLSPFDDDIYLQETAGSLLVTQEAPTGAVNPAELDDANNGATVGVTGTPTFDAGATPTPP